ncbi:MAG: beta-galactosidase, partial [Armatimonadetes bacterium]|nr:beta-galactosidase [Armatimonadota bacterium]
TVRFEATFDLKECKTGGVKLEIAWLRDEAPQLVAISSSPVWTEDGVGKSLAVEAAAPTGATRAWTLAKLLGAGRVCFRELTVCLDGHEVGANPELDPSQGGWQFISWSAGEPEAVKAAWEKPQAACIAYSPRRELEGRPTKALAMVWDWVDFRATALADFMGWFAARIKAADPSRPVVTYTTMSFANPFEWDYVQQMAVEVDKVAAQRHHDVIGMQLASAAGDADSVTAAFDMVRKSGKPMWAVDLLDFSLGVGAGEELLTRTSLAAVQHGASGILYYCWYGTPVYNYTDLGIPALRRMAEAVMAAAEAVEGMRPEVSVALVMPRMPLYAFLPEPPNDWRDFMGWYKLLRRMGLATDVYTLAELPRIHAGRYRAIIVPDCAYLPRGAARALAHCTRNGVKLITSGRFARRDESGEALPAQLRMPPTYVFGDAVGAKLLGACWRHPSPTDTPPRLTTRPGWPDWTTKTVQQVVRRLSALGVHGTKDVVEPFHVQVFRRGSVRRALAVPEAAWKGEVKIGATHVEVSPPWTVVDMGG